MHKILLEQGNITYDQHGSRDLAAVTRAFPARHSGNRLMLHFCTVKYRYKHTSKITLYRSAASRSSNTLSDCAYTELYMVTVQLCAVLQLHCCTTLQEQRCEEDHTYKTVQHC